MNIIKIYSRAKAETAEERLMRKRAASRRWVAKNKEYGKDHMRARNVELRRLRKMEKAGEELTAQQIAQLARQKQDGKKYRDSHKEQIAAKAKIYFEKNKETHRDRCQKYYQQNRDTILARVAKYRIANPLPVSLLKRKRKAQQKTSIPKWFGELDMFIMEEAAVLCILRKQSTGIDWHMDHVVPLQSKKVCGLHIGCNIAVIPAVVNMSKKNNYWPDMS